MVAPWIRGESSPQCITSRGPSPLILLLAIVCLTTIAASAQQFTSGVNLVEVYVSVTDATGQPVRGLTPGDFEVLEDGRPQAVTTFTAGDFPLSVAVAVDRSFSMEGTRLALSRAGARTFLEELRASDEAAVLAIGSRVEVLAPLSRDRRAQLAVVDRLDAFGTTGLHDAILAAIEAIQPARGRRALVLLSDGEDKYSEATATQALQRARESDVMIFPVGLGRRPAPLFAELATLTGGRSFHARDGKGLPEILRAVARELREQYLLGYTPARPIVAGAREWRSIDVRVARPGVQVRARDGYVAK